MVKKSDARMESIVDSKLLKIANERISKSDLNKLIPEEAVNRELGITDAMLEQTEEIVFE